MKFTMRIPAGPGAVFTPDAADKMRGDTVVNMGDVKGTARILVAEVLDDGSAIEVTVELNEEQSELLRQMVEESPDA